MSFGIRRYEFDRYLLERSGANCRLGEPLKSLERVDGRWLVNGAIEATMIVGAGGHFCPVAQRLGARSDRHSVGRRGARNRIRGFGRTIWPAARSMPQSRSCSSATTCKGYGWCFRKGNFLNIGLGRIDAKELSRHVGEFGDFLRGRGKIQCQIPSRFHGHAYQLYERTVPKLIDDGVLLIGDAAGLAYPHSGEGIRPAIESGQIAAESIAAAAGDYSMAKLEPYRQRVLARFGKPSARGPTDWLPAGLLQFLARRLMASRWFARKVMIENWFLHANEPALAPVSGGFHDGEKRT